MRYLTTALLLLAKREVAALSRLAPPGCGFWILDEAGEDDRKQEQVDVACVNERTKLPEGLAIRHQCPGERRRNDRYEPGRGVG